MADNNDPSASSVGIDPLYIKGIPGVLKWLECGFSLLAFILQASAPLCVSQSTSGYFLFVTMTVFILNSIHYAILVFRLKQRVFKCDCIRWPIIEFGYIALVVIFYFFANLFLAIGAACSATSQAATAFGFFAMFTFIADGFLSFRIVWDSRFQHSSQQPEQGNTSNIDAATQRY